MEYLKRLKDIYTLLHQDNFSKKEILKKLNQAVSPRQITRDLETIKLYYLREDEEFVVKKKKKENTYSIKERVAFNILENYKQSGQMDRFEVNDIIDRTDFYELIRSRTFNENLEILYKAISSEVAILVEKIKYYATSETNKTELQDEKIELIPVKIIYHRGDFYLCSFHKKTFRTDEIGQMTGIKILEKKFNRAEQLKNVNKELETRFGITKNINKEIYEIKLQFSNATGKFVKEFRWHSTQKFETLEKSTTKDILMTLRCGINRELVGWIFQWMSNVKVINPPELVALYDEMLEEMRKNKNKEYIPSTNIFNR